MKAQCCAVLATPSSATVRTSSMRRRSTGSTLTARMVDCSGRPSAQMRRTRVNARRTASANPPRLRQVSVSRAHAEDERVGVPQAADGRAADAGEKVRRHAPFFSIARGGRQSVVVPRRDRQGSGWSETTPAHGSYLWVQVGRVLLRVRWLRRASPARSR